LSFGSGGKVVTDFPGEVGLDAAYGAAIQSDGKLVVAGEIDLGFGVARYNPDGALDPSFSEDGWVTTDLGGSGYYAQDLVIDAHGRIVAAGVTFAEDTGRDFILFRYLPNGSLDGAFGGDGMVTTDLGSDETATAVAIQEDGKIVAAGETGGGLGFAICRYMSKGAPDEGFGSGGCVVTDFDGTGTAWALVLQEDGKVLAAGTSGDNFALARFEVDGSPDLTFGTGGKVEDDFLGHAYAVALQSDSKIVVAGDEATADVFAVARYESNGAPDTGFGEDGVVFTPFVGRAVAFGVVVQDNGKIVAGGYGAHHFALARYMSDGSLDPSFGSAGTVTTDFGSEDGVDSGYALVLQADGKLVLAGRTGNNVDKFALARYYGDPAADIYVALGDSVAAGIGLPGSAPNCYRAVDAYPGLVVDGLAGFALNHLACSGASIPRGIAGPQFFDDGSSEPPQLQLAKAELPTKVTLTIGANDVHWKGILEDCYLKNCYKRQFKPGTDEAKFADRLAVLQGNLTWTLQRMEAWSPQPDIIVTNYYWLFPEVYPEDYCWDIDPPVPGIAITTREFDYLKGLLDQVNRVIASVVASEGATLADIRTAFVGHDVCNSHRWIFHLKVLDGQLLDPRSLHPNANGHAAIAQVILTIW